jgi:hypothetical protein
MFCGLEAKLYVSKFNDDRIESNMLYSSSSISDELPKF